MPSLYDGHEVILAPMAGVSDIVFRQICIEHSAQLTYTEMVSAKGLDYANDKTRHLLDLAPNETKVCVQIFGHEPAVMAAQAALIEEELADTLFSIDVNMGCPAKKIAGKGDGSALMKDPDLAASIISAIKSSVDAPVTAKFRRGFEVGDESAVEFAKRLEAAGADAVAVHGRYAKQFYRGDADWDVIAAVVDAVQIPVVGNGDITSETLACEMRRKTGCSAVMVGRGAQGNPWLFDRIAAAFAGEPIPSLPSIDDRIDTAQRHALLLSQIDRRVVVRMRKHAMWYLQGLRGASFGRREINECVTYEDFFDVLEKVRITAKGGSVDA